MLKTPWGDKRLADKAVNKQRVAMKGVQIYGIVDVQNFWSDYSIMFSIERKMGSL